MAVYLRIRKYITAKRWRADPPLTAAYTEGLRDKVCDKTLKGKI
ncbi:MAG: hypothetical protein QXJ75_02090 [Candidatus Bathyarchaeia archaeon]